MKRKRYVSMFGGKIMDNFMDKLAQKWNASELIKANSAAEAMELRRLQEQVAEYETILQEMRKLNLKNAELAENSRELVNHGISEINKLLTNTTKDNNIEETLTNMEEQLRQLQTLLSNENEQKEADAIAVKMEDFIHKENVKVYRNVQAVVVDNLKTQTEDLKQENEKLSKKISCIIPLLIVTLLLLIGNIGLGVVQILGIF